MKVYILQKSLTNINNIDKKEFFTNASTLKEFIKEMIENKSTLTIERDNKGKIKRRTYSPDVRKLIYNYANGRCELCGRKILFDDMTIDHIKPLSMGGADVVENLACTCYTCNTFKGNVNPDNFMERISLIYLYQLEKKCKNKVKWAVMRKILNHVN